MPQPDPFSKLDTAILDHLRAVADANKWVHSTRHEILAACPTAYPVLTGREIAIHCGSEAGVVAVAAVMGQDVREDTIGGFRRWTATRDFGSFQVVAHYVDVLVGAS